MAPSRSPISHCPREFSNLTRRRNSQQCRSLHSSLGAKATDKVTLANRLQSPASLRTAPTMDTCRLSRSRVQPAHPLRLRHGSASLKPPSLRHPHMLAKPQALPARQLPAHDQVTTDDFISHAPHRRLAEDSQTDTLTSCCCTAAHRDWSLKRALEDGVLEAQQKRSFTPRASVHVFPRCARCLEQVA